MRRGAASCGRPRSVDSHKAGLIQSEYDEGTPVKKIVEIFKVSQATAYRSLNRKAAEEPSSNL